MSLVSARRSIAAVWPPTRAGYIAGEANVGETGGGASRVRVGFRDQIYAVAGSRGQR
jgi:hypothetical protein